MKQLVINTRTRITKEHMRLVALLLFALGVTVLLHVLLIVVEKGIRSGADPGGGPGPPPLDPRF